MTEAAILFLLFLAVAGVGAGVSTRRIFGGVKARMIVCGLATLPVVGYCVWGLTIGCFDPPANEAAASKCSGWGFGLIVFVIVGMPAWLFALGLGYWIGRAPSGFAP